MTESRFIDIKETDFGIEPVTGYILNEAKGAVGEDFSITLPCIEEGYGPGADITIKNIDGFVTTKEYVVGEDGYQTVISGVSKIVDLIRKAPGKTLMYMSMTPVEKEEFEIANLNSNGKVDYSGLDYIPLIKVCDERKLTEGWKSDEVIGNLVDRMGLELVCNVRSYWVRQVQADIQSSFFDTIVSLVNFLKPIIFLDGEILYILSKPLRGGSVSFEKVATASHREIFNYNSRVSHLKLLGGLGAWDRAKQKGNVEAEKEVTMSNTVGSETGLQMYHRLNGDVNTVEKWLGIRNTEGDVTINFTMNQPMTDETTTTEVYRLDPFGNVKALLSRYTVTLNSLLGDPHVKTFESTETYTYDYLTEEYDRPRLTQRTTKTGRYTWQLVGLAGQEAYRYFKQKVDEVIEKYVYAPNGNLLAEVMTRTTDVFKVGDMAVELDLGDYYWVAEGQDPYDGAYERAIVEERVTRYRQLTPDTYEQTVYHRSLGGVRRKLGDGRHEVKSEMIKGRVPKHPRSFRKMQVYDEIISETETLEVPAMVVSNPNIVDWDDASGLLGEIKHNTADFLYTVERNIVLPKDIEIDSGWGVLFGSLPAGLEEDVPSVSVVDGVISGWSKRKDAKTGTVSTVINLEGKAEG